VALVAAAAGCGTEADEGAGERPPAVIATTSILGDLVQQVVGDCTTVDVLLPAGTDPHDAELSARQGADLRRADVVFAFGLGLEEQLDDALDAAADDGVTVVEAAASVDALPLDEHRDEDTDDEHRDEDTDDEHGSWDPHVWQDPVRMAQVVDVIETTLRDTTDCPAPAISDRADAYRAELLALDREVAARYDTIPDERRVLVTNHDAFAYLADRYDLRIVGTVIPGGSTLAEPSAADLADLVAVVEREQVPAIFGETLDSTALVDALAAELDRPIDVVELHSDSLGAADSDAATYVDLVRSNAARITDALAGG
jgi:zinc/manganese transport system substrate-binding protein